MEAVSEFRAIWPILDDRVHLPSLLAEAKLDLPELTARARARLTGPGTFSVERSVLVPGSGRITEYCLIYTAPARPLPARDYHGLRVVA